MGIILHESASLHELVIQTHPNSINIRKQESWSWPGVLPTDIDRDTV